MNNTPPFPGAPPESPPINFERPPPAPPPFDIGTLAATLAPHLLQIIRKDNDKRGRERAFRTYALMIMIGGKSWEEARDLALEVLRVEDLAAEGWAPTHSDPGPEPESPLS